ncbi:NAD dependent epimerase/dehydratase family protein [Bacteroidales bacterium KHT7]|nr:NAD dependent epimerase/dehydratase family protein [Bacteroidales bacterium KHT7]
MNILLTGGAGYIGSHTIIELDKAGHSVVVVDNLVNSNPESLRRVAKIIGKEIPFYEVMCAIRKLSQRCSMRTTLMRSSLRRSEGCRL